MNTDLRYVPMSGSAVISAAVVVVVELLAPALVEAAPLPAHVLPSLRRLLGLQPPVAVAGTRSFAHSISEVGEKLCLVSPLRISGSDLVAVTFSGSPAIVSREPLAEVSIYDGLKQLARLVAPLGGELPQPLLWPLPAMKPASSLDLWLRPLSSQKAFAVIQLDRPDNGSSPMSVTERTSAGHWEALLQDVLAGDQQARQQMDSLLKQACTIDP